MWVLRGERLSTAEAAARAERAVGLGRSMIEWMIARTRVDNKQGKGNITSPQNNNDSDDNNKATAPPLPARECCRECTCVAAAAVLARSPTWPRMCLMMALPLVRFR